MKYVHIGWCKEDIHDKVWGVICLQDRPEPHKSGLDRYDPVTGNWLSMTGKYVTFWGRRGAKLQTKIVEADSWTINEMFRKKTNKGYKEVDKNELDEVYPEFQTDLEKTAFWATFKI